MPRILRWVGNRNCPEFHRWAFLEFCQKEMETGGPDPHVKMAAYLASQSEDPPWVAGCYTASYVVSTGLAVAFRWSRKDALNDRSRLETWIRRHWEYLPIRKERKVNGVGPKKMSEILNGYAQWLDNDGLKCLNGLEFQESFRSLDFVPHHGRYFKLKLHETLRLIGDSTAEYGLCTMNDAVPKGGTYSRKGLALLYPEHNYKSGKKEDLNEANQLVNGLLEKLADRGVYPGWFAIEALLCNYRQSVDGSQYPGRALDSELGHYYIVRKRFPSVQSLLRCRSELFDSQFLGEVQGWSGRRVELGKVMMQYGYVWSDAEYNYLKTTDLEQPVRWSR